MPWTPPKGAEPLKPSTFWKPDVVGEALIGTYETTKVGRNEQWNDVLVFTNAVVIPVSGAWRSFEVISLSRNSWLDKLFSKKLEGKPVAVQYSGEKDTPAGAMNTYEVYPMAHDDYAKIVKAAPAPSVMKAAAGPGLGHSDADDDPPFGRS